MNAARKMVPTGPGHLTVLGPADCEDWVLRVSLLRRHWRKRHPQAPFFTLGLAAYLDAGTPGADYHDRGKRADNNRLLRSHFAPLLQQVADALCRHLAERVEFADEEAALPGFHIYLPHPVFGQPVASVHRDLQHRAVFPDATDSDALFSFTLALSTPAGSGLKLWEPAGFVPYRDGELLLHDGLSIHQAILACTNDVERITLQGHGIRRGPRILLYW